MFSLGTIYCMDLSIFHSAGLLVVIFGILWLSSAIIKYIWEWSIVVSVSRDSNMQLQLPPGSMGFPIIGETFSFLWKGCQFYHQKMEKHGNIYKTHLLGSPTVRVIGAEYVKKIIFGENDIVTQKWPTSTKLLLGEGSVTQSTGNIHRIRRKTLKIAFRTDSLSDFVPLLQEKVCTALEGWCDRRNILAYPACKHMTFTAAARAMLGLEIDTLKGKEMSSIFIDFLSNIMSIPLDIPGFGFHKGMHAKRRLMEELRKQVAYSKEHGGIFPTPVMDMYNEICERLGTDDEHEVSEGMLDLLFAGHETLASVTTNSIMLLGQYKDVVEKIRKELVNNNIPCGSEQPTYDLSYQKIGELKYVSHVVKEVLRLCPPVGAGFRKVLRDFKLGDYLIPKDWTVVYSIRETQQTSPIFDESESFRPERWDAIEEQNGSSTFHYIPFSTGARGCIGKSYALILAKIFVIELARRCDWTLKNPNPKMRYIPVPIATDHLPIRIVRRPSNVPG